MDGRQKGGHDDPRPNSEANSERDKHPITGRTVRFRLRGPAPSGSLRLPCRRGEKARFSFLGHRSELGDGVHVARGPVTGSGDAQLGAADSVRIMDIDLARAQA